jgi:hypothetical protein
MDKVTFWLPIKHASLRSNPGTPENKLIKVRKSEYTRKPTNKISSVILEKGLCVIVVHGTENIEMPKPILFLCSLSG